jgi:tetratricopeptide (TPR) repeat protein
MTRQFAFTSVGIGLILGAGVSCLLASPPDSEFNNRLKIQAVMLEAKEYMHVDPGKAVQVLEDNLFRIDGDREYLKLLRLAYSKYIPNLHFAGQQEQAQKYLGRLRILDPHEAETLAKNPKADATTANSVSDTANPSPVEQQQAKAAADSLPKAHQPLAPVNLPVPTVQPVALTPPGPKFRANNDNTDGPEQINLAVKADEKRRQALTLLQQAEDSYTKKLYCEACAYYDQAHQIDSAITAGCRDRWAYSKLSHVMARMKQAPGKDASFADLKQQVQSALVLEPKLTAIGQKMLEQIEAIEQAQGQGPLSVQHHTATHQGWNVAETAYFRIYHKQSRDYVNQVGQTAELTRAKMSEKWFGTEAQSWQNKCDIYLYATADAYSQATKVPKQSPGHSRIEAKNGMIVGRTVFLHCDNFDLLPAILPHEVTHVILAGQFGKQDVPRWVDEGIAVLTEPADKINVHRQSVPHYSQSGQLFALKDLMEQPDYPAADRIRIFYAQSVSLVDFLTQQRGPQVFTRFVRDGMQGGYLPALRHHYGYQDFNELQTRWSQHVLSGSAGGVGVAQN